MNTNRIYFMIDNKEFNRENLLNSYGGLVDIIMDDCYIGTITLQVDETKSLLNLEFVYLYNSYRGKGYSKMVLERLKYAVKDFGFNSIAGTCCDDLISLYRSIGASFKKRTSLDYCCINNKFYIDI